LKKKIAIVNYLRPRGVRTRLLVLINTRLLHEVGNRLFQIVYALAHGINCGEQITRQVKRGDSRTIVEKARVNHIATGEEQISSVLCQSYFD
jgi:hypothetical protein